MLLLDDKCCMTDLFSTSSVQDDFYVYPVNASAAMCLDVVKVESVDSGGLPYPEIHPSVPSPQQLPSNHHHHRPHQHLQSIAPSPYPDTSNSPTQYGVPTSNSACPDTGKLLKPQYTAELEVLCRICGDRASGFHYGVHSCEGCKGFFRRTLKKQLVYKPCQAGSRCSIDTGSRNKCQYCRYQRCLYAGMSQDAVRFGRMPKAEREKLLADREELATTNTRRIVELRSLTDLIKAAFRDTFANTILGSAPRHHQQQQQPQQQQLQPSQQPFSQPPLQHPRSMTPLSYPPSPMSASSHLGSDRGRVPSPSSMPGRPLIGEPSIVLDSVSSEQFFSHNIFWRYQELTVPVMEKSVRFAKRIPGFTSLKMRDQILLMKRNGFMVVNMALQTLVTPNFLYLDTKDGPLCIRRNGYFLCEQMGSLFDRILTLLDRVRNLNLTTGELSLFTAVLLTHDCPDLNSPSQVEMVQSNLIDALRLELKHNHPKERTLLARVLMLLPDLAQIVEEFSMGLKNQIFDPTPGFRNVMPLMREIFDVDSSGNKPLPGSSSSPSPSGHATPIPFPSISPPSFNCAASFVPSSSAPPLLYHPMSSSSSPSSLSPSPIPGYHQDDNDMALGPSMSPPHSSYPPPSFLFYPRLSHTP